MSELIAVCLMTILLNGQTNWVVEDPLIFYPSALTCEPALSDFGRKILRGELEKGVLAKITCGCMTLEQANEFGIPFPKLVPERGAEAV